MINHGNGRVSTANVDIQKLKELGVDSLATESHVPPDFRTLQIAATRAQIENPNDFADKVRDGRISQREAVDRLAPRFR